MKVWGSEKMLRELKEIRGFHNTVGEGIMRNEAGEKSWLGRAHSPRASKAPLRGFHSVLSTLAFKRVVMFCFLNSRTKFPVKTQPVMQVRGGHLRGRGSMAPGEPREQGLEDTAWAFACLNKKGPQSTHLHLKFIARMLMGSNSQDSAIKFL